MTTMSDDGDRTCPLCAEEMDLTDQQLKPCKCGYEICVWCWHHIIDMAEKEDSEGRCPACRTPYNKQRIVGMAADCKRMVAEVNAERKQKSQKTKIKTSTIEDRKHLSSVRVVQRNLVYIMGMPSSLADESILERKEYFGQYGKILKVSFSRQAGTTTQQASNNNTSSVYITYAREEEAVRCIQAVHSFVLEGKLLRACFGTTKYCYTWLRNMTCSNPDCLYLHDIGSQEDSFTKDEIISAYTRSRVPQIASNNLQPRAGNVLPPTADDCCNNGTISSKHVLKSASNNIATQVKGSNDTSGARSTVLPVAASWALRVSNCLSPASSMACTQSQIKQKLEILNNSSCSSSMVSSINQTSAWHDDAVATSKIPEGTHVGHTDGWSRPSEPLKSGIGRDYQTKVSDLSSESDRDAGHTLVSAWVDNITMLRLPEGRHVVLRDDRSRPTEPLRPTNGTDCLTSVLDASAEIVLDGAHKSAWDDDAVTPSKILKGRHIVHIDGRNKSSDTLDPGSGPSKSSVSDVSSQIFMDEAPTSGISISCSSSPLPPAHQNKDGGIIVSIVNTNFVNSTSPGGLDNQSSSSCPDDITPGSTAFNGNMQSLCLGLSSVNLDSHLGVDHLNMDRHQSAASDHCLAGMHGILDLGLQQYYPEHGVECLTSAPLSKASVKPYVRVSGELSNSRSELQKQVLSPAGNGMEDALVHVNDKKHRLSGVTNQPSHLSFDNYPLKISYHLTRSSQNDGDAGDKHLTVDKNSRIMGSEMDKGLLSLRDNESVFFNGHKEEMPSSSAKLERVSEYPDMSYTDKELKYLGGFDDVANIDKTSNVNMGEGSIVSDILSLDFDPWDDSWSSANNFAKLLGQKDKHDGPSKLSSSWKSHSSNQSRFSFARQEYQANPEDSSCRDIGHAQNLFPSTQESYGNRFENTFSMNGFEGASAYVTSGSVISSDRTDGVGRAKISAPPGFSFPNRAPPPGFSSQDRYDQAYDACSESNLLGSSLQNQFQVYTAGNAGDVEFIDPAILAVGKGRLPLGVNNTGLGLRSFPSQYGTSESDTRIQLLMQQSIANQDPRISNHIGDRFLHLNDAYISSRFSVQNHSSISPFAQISCQQPSSILNNQWDGWNDVPIGNGMGFADILRNERFGLNNYFPVNEEPKFHISSSGDQYNRAFGM